MENRRIIVVKHGEQKELAKLFKCTNVWVCQALKFKKDTPLTKKIRKAALERGGYLVELKHQNYE